MDSTSRPVWHSRVWLATVAVLTVLALLVLAAGTNRPVAAALAVLLPAGIAAGVIAWAVVRTRRQRRAYEDNLAAWATDRAAQAERLRIARDLHDLASHGLALITVRAAATRALTGPAAEAERARALAEIERASRAATTELRRMLGVLRTADDAASLRPPETLAELPAIVEAARAAGVVANLEVGDLGDVSAGVELAVCAIVREALTNTARHAGPTRARVTVHAENRSVVVTVEDEGPRPGWRPLPGTGHGLTGLRERVATMGGAFVTEQTGPGFRLTARLPEARQA